MLPGQRITRRQRGRAAPQQPGHGGPTVLPAPQGARRAGRGGLHGGLSSLPVLRPEKRDHCTMLLETKPREI